MEQFKEVIIDGEKLMRCLVEAKHLKSEIIHIPSKMLNKYNYSDYKNTFGYNLPQIYGESFNSVFNIGVFEKLFDVIFVIPEDLNVEYISFFSKSLNPFFKDIKENEVNTDKLSLLIGYKQVGSIVKGYVCRISTIPQTINEENVTISMDCVGERNNISTPIFENIINYISKSENEDISYMDVTNNESFRSIIDDHKTSDGAFRFVPTGMDGRSLPEYMSYISKSILDISKNDSVYLCANKIDFIYSLFNGVNLMRFIIVKKSKKCKIDTIFITRRM
nr:MAG TPA: hypothetical protein [Caudoviricetes sp.]